MEDKNPGLIAAAAAVINHIVTALSPQFLALIGINVVFIVGLLWFLHGEQDNRERAFEVIVTACLQHHG